MESCPGLRPQGLLSALGSCNPGSMIHPSDCGLACPCAYKEAIGHREALQNTHILMSALNPRVCFQSVYVYAFAVLGQHSHALSAFVASR